MFADNSDALMGFIREEGTGAFLAESGFRGAANGSCTGAISIREITGYVEKKCDRTAIFSPGGEPAPYNGEPHPAFPPPGWKNRASVFSNVREWIFDLPDFLN